MYHEEHVGKASAKIDPVDVMVFGGFWVIDIAALWAIELHHRLSRYV